MAATAKAATAATVAMPAAMRCFVVVRSARSAARSPQRITRSSQALGPVELEREEPEPER